MKRTELDEQILTQTAKGQKIGFVIAIPLLICFGVAKCAGVDFRSDLEKLCAQQGGIYQSPRGAKEVCLKRSDIIESPKDAEMRRR